VLISERRFQPKASLLDDRVFLQVDAHNGLAVYDQIVRQVKFAVADAALRPGELVPSVREVARELAINPNTVARAYRQLQDDGVLEPVRGTGLAVASAARRQCQLERTRLIRARLRTVLEEAVQSGLEPEEIEQLVRAESIAARKAKQKN
jgi:GntR family transcriptional regulator